MHLSTCAKFKFSDDSLGRNECYSICLPLPPTADHTEAHTAFSRAQHSQCPPLHSALCSCSASRSCSSCVSLSAYSKRLCLVRAQCIFLRHCLCPDPLHVHHQRSVALLLQPLVVAKWTIYSCLPPSPHPPPHAPGSTPASAALATRSPLPQASKTRSSADSTPRSIIPLDRPTHLLDRQTPVGLRPLMSQASPTVP